MSVGSFSLYAQTEEELDRLLLDDQGMGTGPQYTETEAEKISPFAVSGFLQITMPFSTKENQFYDNTGRIKLRPLYESDKIRAYADIDFYTEISDNPVHDKGQIETVEMYVNGGEKFLWKIGKQRVSWGAGDAFQPTNMVDRRDLRTSFFTENDDRYTGVYGLSGKYIFNDHGIEFVLRPVTEAPLAPSGFYATESSSVDTPMGEVSTSYEEGEMSNELDDLSFGVRAGGTSGILDWHVTVYSGMSNALVYRSYLCYTDSEYTIDLEPVSERCNAMGGDLSFVLDKFNIRLEGVYSPDMVAVKETDSSALAALFAEAAENGEVALQETEIRNFASYSSGFDYNLWGDYGTVYIEWMQSRYLNEENIEPILQTDILMVRIEDSFFSQSLNLKGSVMARTRDNGPGLIVNGEGEYDLKNGCTFGAGIYYFAANDDEYVLMFEDKSIVYGNVKFLF